jgi:hypothetical protein
MSTDTWLAVSAGATFLLALAAFWAIWQNHVIQEKERKARLLNEIQKWASEALSLILSRFATVQIKQKSEAVVWEELKFLAKDNLSIQSAAAGFGSELSETVNNAIEALNNYAGITRSGLASERPTHQKSSKEYLEKVFNAIGTIRIKEKI